MATAAVKSTTSVESAATAVKPSTAVEAIAAVEIATVIAPSTVAAAIAAIKAAATIIAAVLTVISAATIIAAPVAVSAAVVAVAVIAVVPGAGTYEDAADEPVRAIVAVGGASVGIIVVVAVGADWRGTVIGRSADSYAEGDALCVRIISREETKTKQNSE